MARQDHLSEPTDRFQMHGVEPAQPSRPVPEPHAPPGRRMSPGLPLWPFVLLLLAGAGGFAGWYWWNHRSTPLELPSPVAAPEPIAAPVPAPPPAPALPPSDRTDPLVRTQFGALSSHPSLAKWLEATDLVRRFVAAVFAVAQGDSPRQALNFLEPAGAFRAQEKVGRRNGVRSVRSFIDPESYRRYDLIADVLDSVEISKVAAAYAELAPLFEMAHAEIAPPGTTFAATLGKAVGRLAALPLPDEKVELEAHGAVYRYADPKLEALSAAEKHLLRMGPKNMSRVQGKLKELAAALQPE